MILRKPPRKSSTSAESANREVRHRKGRCGTSRPMHPGATQSLPNRQPANVGSTTSRPDSGHFRSCANISRRSIGSRMSHRCAGVVRGVADRFGRNLARQLTRESGEALDARQIQRPIGRNVSRTGGHRQVAEGIDGARRVVPARQFRQHGALFNEGRDWPQIASTLAANDHQIGDGERQQRRRKPTLPAPRLRSSKIAKIPSVGDNSC